MSSTGTNALSELDAINMMLESIFEAPVNTLDVAGIADVAIAQRTLSAKVREVCLKGLAFNSEQQVTLTRSTDGKVPLPLNTLRVIPTRDSGVDAVQRGGYLYDRKNHTFIFTDDVKVDIIYHFEWDDLPEHVKFPIAVCAARKFQAKTFGDAEKGEFDREDETQAKALLYEADTDSDDANMYADSWSVASILER